MTPALRRWTASMNAGGHDHSRPTSRPTLRGSLMASIVSRDVQVHHLLPKRPIVRPAVPNTQGMPDALVPEHLREGLVSPEHSVITADGKRNVLAAQGRETVCIVLVC